MINLCKIKLFNTNVRLNALNCVQVFMYIWKMNANEVNCSAYLKTHLEKACPPHQY